MKQKSSRSSTSEKVTTGYISQVLLSLNVVTVAALVVVVQAGLHVDAPSSLLVGIVILGAALSKFRTIVIPALGAVIVLFDLGERIELLAKVTSLVNGVPLPAWASAPAPAPVPAPVPVAPAPVLAADPAPVPAPGDDTKQQQADVLASSALPPDFSPPAFSEPIYDGSVVGMAERRPNGATDALDIDIRPRGRHAKAEAQPPEEQEVPPYELTYEGLTYVGYQAPAMRS